MAPTQTESSSSEEGASLSPIPLKSNRRSLIHRLFGRKKNQTVEGEEPTGRVKGARAGKKWNKKGQDTPSVGEEREPEAAKSPAPKPETENPVAREKKLEETKETPETPSKSTTEAPVDASTEKAIPETVESEAETEEDKVAPSTESNTEKPATEEDKADKTVDAENIEETPEESPKEDSDTEEVKTTEMQAGDDSSRDPPMTEQLKAAALFCGCI